MSKLEIELEIELELELELDKKLPLAAPYPRTKRLAALLSHLLNRLSAFFAFFISFLAFLGDLRFFFFSFLLLRVLPPINAASVLAFVLLFVESPLFRAPVLSRAANTDVLW